MTTCVRAQNVSCCFMRTHSGKYRRSARRAVARARRVGSCGIIAAAVAIPIVEDTGHRRQILRVLDGGVPSLAPFVHTRSRPGSVGLHRSGGSRSLRPRRFARAGGVASHAFRRRLSRLGHQAVGQGCSETRRRNPLPLVSCVAKRGFVHACAPSGHRARSMDRSRSPIAEERLRGILVGARRGAALRGLPFLSPRDLAEPLRTAPRTAVRRTVDSTATFVTHLVRLDRTRHTCLVRSNRTRWVTNVAIESPVRRRVLGAVRKGSAKSRGERKGKPDAESSTPSCSDDDSAKPLLGDRASGSVHAAGSVTGEGAIVDIPRLGDATHKRQRVPSARLAASLADGLVSKSRTTSSKRVRGNAPNTSEPPGAKRARAAATVKAFVKDHYAGLGIPWLPRRPIWADSDEEGDGSPGPDGGDLGASGRGELSNVEESEVMANAAGPPAGMGEGREAEGAAVEDPEYLPPVRPHSLAEILAGGAGDGVGSMWASSRLGGGANAGGWAGRACVGFGGVVGSGGSSSFSTMFSGPQQRQFQEGSHRHL